MRRIHFFAPIVAMTLAGSVSVAAQEESAQEESVTTVQRWRIVNLSTFVPRAINNINWVAGQWSSTPLDSSDGVEFDQFGAGGFCSPNPNRQAAVFGYNTLTLVGAGPGSDAFGINGRKWTVGYECVSIYSDYYGDYVDASIPFVSKNGVVYPIQSNPTSVGAARAINDRGDIVGWSDPSVDLLFYDNPPQVWDAKWPYNRPLTSEPISVAPAAVAAVDDVNKSGAYIFSLNWTDESARTVCALVSSTTWTNIPDDDVYGAGPECLYSSVNDIGDVAANDGANNPYLFSNGILTYLSPGVHGTARQMNNLGVVVGSIQTGSGLHAAMWRNGTLTDLNDLLPATSGWTLTRAIAVNDHGFIVGIGQHGGQWLGFELVPMPALK
jgi:hypothetical protein